MEIESLLQNNIRSLKDFKPISYPKNYVLDFLGNRLVCEERQYVTTTQTNMFQELFDSLIGDKSYFFL